MLHPCEAVVGSIRPWLTSMMGKCIETGISRDFLRSKEIDHICFRCRSNDEYLQIRMQLTSNDIGSLLVEGMIGGRPISTILLSKPYAFEDWRIPCIEVACPKPDKSHAAGLEHLEVTIGGVDDGFYNSKEKLMRFASMYPLIEFDLKAVEKVINADISMSLGNHGHIKFHVRSLQDVCNYELSSGAVEKVPPDYFL